MVEYSVCNAFASHSTYVIGTRYVSPPPTLNFVDYKYCIFLEITASWYLATLLAVDICDAYGELDVLHMCRHVVRCLLTRSVFSCYSVKLFFVTCC